MMAMGIYAIVSPKADKIYVGSALDYAKRQSQHWTDLNRGCHCNVHLQRLHNKHGDLRFVELEPVLFSTDLVSREQAWIDAMAATVPDRLVNFCLVAGSRLGTTYTKTPEQIEKVASIHRGARRSDETRERISVSNTGKKRSEETKANMRAAALARWQRKDERDRLCTAAAHRSDKRSRDERGRWA